MEARPFRPARFLRGMATVLIFLLCHAAQAQFTRVRESAAQSQNFIVFASSPDWAAQLVRVAEENRRDLAVHWLGKELPPWSERCPIHVTTGSNLGASGETRFSPIPGGVGNWMMSVQGTPERIIDSVLPHEISHTIFATHFAAYGLHGKFVPRWADEGACTTVEHEAEKRKHRHYLHEFLKSGRGLAFNRMFSLKEYPPDILPLYAQGHSAVQFLIDQSSPADFIKFIEQGMQTGDWRVALQEHYDYQSIGEFQTLWNRWLFDGSPEKLVSYAPKLQQVADEIKLASDVASSHQLKGSVHFAIGNDQPTPVQLASNQRLAGDVDVDDDPNELPTSIPQTSSGESWYQQRLRDVRESVAVEKDAVGHEPVAANPQPAFPASDIHTPASISLADRPTTGAEPTLSFASGTPHAVLQSLNSDLPGNAPSAASAHQTTARPQPIQSTQIQVLDWGHSHPVAGIQPTGLRDFSSQSAGSRPVAGQPAISTDVPPPKMVPILR